MSTIERSIDVHVPVHTAYDQWTQFETFPQFMEGVEDIRQLSDTRTHWRTSIAGVRREFDAEITEQLPDERIAWRSDEGERQAGVVTFHRLDADNTRIMLQLEFEPQGALEKAGDVLGVVGHRVKGDLARFKTFIEERGGATGGWRGEVPRSPQRGETADPYVSPTGTAATADPYATPADPYASPADPYAGTTDPVTGADPYVGDTDPHAPTTGLPPRTTEDPNAVAHGAPPVPPTLPGTDKRLLSADPEDVTGPPTADPYDDRRTGY